MVKTMSTGFAKDKYRILDPSDFLYSLGRVNLRGAEVSDPPQKNVGLKLLVLSYICY